MSTFLPKEKALGMYREMYKIRKPLYERFADHMIDNNGSPDAAVDQILMILEGIL